MQELIEHFGSSESVRKCTIESTLFRLELECVFKGLLQHNSDLWVANLMIVMDVDV